MAEFNDEHLLPYSTEPKPTPHYVTHYDMPLEQLLTGQKTLAAAGNLESYKAPWRAMLKQVVIAAANAGYYYVEVQSEDHFRLTIYLVANTSFEMQLPQGFLIREGDTIVVYAGQATTASFQLLGVKGEKK